MYIKLLEDSPRFWRGKSLVKRCRCVSVEIIHHECDSFSIRIPHINHCLDFFSPISGGPMFPDMNVTNSLQWLRESKDAACSVPDIFGVNLPVASRSHWKRFSSLSKQLIWFLIHTNDWVKSVVRPFIYVKDIFHTGYKFRVFFLGETPVVVSVRPQFVFFSVRRMVSWLTGSSRMTLAFSSRSLNVQRACPSGTGPQARAINCASARPSTLRRALSELTLRLRVRQESKPSSANFLTVYDTVAMCTAQRLAHCSSRYYFPWASSISRSIWQRLRTVSVVALLRMTALSRFTCSSESFTRYFLSLGMV